MHLRTRLVCSEIISFSFEKVRDVFQEFKELCTENLKKFAMFSKSSKNYALKIGENKKAIEK